MDNLTKLKCIKRWQQDKKLKKFVCQNNKDHGELKPILTKNDVLLFCPICQKTYKCINEKVYDLGHLLLLQDKKNWRKK